MNLSNPKARLEAFCDGVFAIALTLLIIDINIPSTERIESTKDLWLALQTIGPAIMAFLLSFIVIFITWVNHHESMKLVQKTSPHFIYANGFLLLTVVFIPFPTSLVGEFIMTDHAAPAVTLYCFVFGLQSLAWNLMTISALSPSDPLITDEKPAEAARINRRRSFFACIFYSLCAITATWFPLEIAILTAISWILWLIIGINIKKSLNHPD